MSHSITIVANPFEKLIDVLRFSRYLPQNEILNQLMHRYLEFLSITIIQNKYEFIRQIDFIE